MNFSSSMGNFSSMHRSSLEEDSPYGKMSATNPYFGESYQREYMKELSSHQDRALKQMSRSYNSQEASYDKIKSALHSQLDSLREQIRLNNEIQKKEIERVCEDYEHKLDGIRKDREKIVFELEQQIKDTEDLIDHEQEKIGQEKFDLEDIQVKHESTVKILETEIQELEEKIKLSKDFLENKAQNEVNHLENLISSQLEEHKKNIEKITKNHEDWVDITSKELKEKDKQIEKLENEVLVLQEEILKQEGAVQEEINLMEKTLKDSQRQLKRQKQELERLIHSESETKNQENLLSKEYSLVERELRRVNNDNRRLNEEIKKLEQLVYGKNVIFHKS